MTFHGYFSKIMNLGPHLRILLDPEQEGLKPADGGLDVRVEEDENVGGGGTNPSHPAPHQTLPLFLSQKFDFAAELRVVLDVVIEPRSLNAKNSSQNNP